jgi:sugar phosphate permease
VGLQVLAKLAPDSSTWLVVIGLFVMGVGLAVSMPVVQSVAMQQSTPQTAGAISGSLGLASQVAGILGITFIGSLTTRVALDQWAAGGGDPSLDALVGVGDVKDITAQAGDAAGQLAALSYSSGVDVAFTVAAVLTVIAGIIGLIALPKRPMKPSADVPAMGPVA